MELDFQNASFRILTHHIYEYRKGLRNLVLHTVNTETVEDAEHFLKKKNISFFRQRVSSKKTNLFFGDSSCINIVKSFKVSSLSDLTDEQDFILGIMLGYDQRLQCSRYLERKNQGCMVTI